ncbi:hypothetical protein NDU88_005562 [Pleurodeles waltl]|uniref:Uncharacterized protein n=1 Tax=Pleurodeles waltl TaxID=8319 RepID=A0AAV7RJG2_PLEWA|nr:hypothetical protein NDU88_005562 [Pleurodeles waltl]
MLPIRARILQGADPEVQPHQYSWTPSGLLQGALRLQPYRGQETPPSQEGIAQSAAHGGKANNEAPQATPGREAT